MPEIGEIRRGKEIGYKGQGRFVWRACEGCGKERWIRFLKGQVHQKRCRSCKTPGFHHSEQTKDILRKLNAGNKHYNWKGGRIKVKAGYIMVKLQPDDFFYLMASVNGYVFEHRLVVAKALGRCLHQWEIVHHKEGFAKDDNRYPETLQLVTDDRHKQITILELKINRLLDRQRELELAIEKLMDKEVTHVPDEEAILARQAIEDDYKEQIEDLQIGGKDV